ncbi:hypothetical protein VNO77_05931 [Canavalia gladiata]|uniref:Cytochrome b561 domain-containing protein n=1 Tax=Canavalia gladiata TaxID=3824 RepID=A0AAN9N4Y4_CANGL
MEVQMHAYHPQGHFQKIYGILILVGWGTLLPIGAMVARYLRKFPVVCDAWYKFHIVCQSQGYVLGTIGWFMWIGMSSNHFVSKTQTTLNIIAFTFINVQMLATIMRPNKEAGYCKCWKICHHVLGDAIIGIVIADIFVGLHNQSQSETLKWVYLGILGALGVVVVPLEIFRCKTMIMHLAVGVNSGMFTISP